MSNGGSPFLNDLLKRIKTIALGLVALPYQPTLSFDPAVFTATDDPVNTRTFVGLVGAGSSASGFLQAANAAALKAQVVTSLTTGQMCYVTTFRSYFSYDSTSTQAESGGQVYQPNAGSGRWTRLPIASWTWHRQTQWLAKAGGNIENSGATSGQELPLDSTGQAELARRLGIEDGVVAIYPLGSGADDGPRVSTNPSGGVVSGIWNILTPGYQVWHRPGPNGEPWQFNTQAAMPSGFDGYGTAGMGWYANLSGVSDGFSQAAALTAHVQTLSGVDLVLMSDVEPGASSVAVVSSSGVVPQQTYVTVGQASPGIGNTYLVTSVTAISGGFAIGLDVPVEFAAPKSSCTAQVVLSAPTDIRFDGRGMIVSCSGDAVSALSGAIRCRVGNFLITNTPYQGPVDNGGITLLHDSYTRDCEFYDIRVIERINTADGLFLAAVNNCRYTNIDMRLLQGADGTGYVSNYSSNSVHTGCHFSQNAVSGAQIQNLNKRLTYIDCHADSNGASGWSLIEGDDHVFVACTGHDNVSDGAVVSQVTVPCNRTRFTACSFRRNSVGLDVQQCTDPEIECIAENNFEGNAIITSAAVNPRIDITAGSEFVSSAIASIAGSSPIVVTASATLVGPIGSPIQVVIAGVTGSGAATVNGQQSGTLTGPTTVSLPLASTGTYTLTSATVLQVVPNGVNVTGAAVRFANLKLRGLYGGESGYSQTSGSDVTVDDLDVQLLTNQTPIFVGGGVLTVDNGIYSAASGVSGAFPYALQPGSTLFLTGRHVGVGAGIGACGAIQGTSCTVVYGDAVDLSAFESGFRFFGTMSLYRHVHSSGAPHNFESIAVSVAGSNVTLSEVQYSYPIIVLSGTLTAGIQIVFPNLPGYWTVDTSAVVFAGHAITLASGSGTSTAIATQTIGLARSTGSNAIVFASGQTGATGAAGTNGTNGTNGANGAAGTNAFTTTSASFAMPAIGSSVSVTVGTNAWAVIGQTVFVATAGYMTIAGTTGGLQLTNLGYLGNASSGTTIAGASQVSPAGVIGATGAPGAACTSYWTTGVKSGTSTLTTTQTAVTSTLTGVVVASGQIVKLTATYYASCASGGVAGVLSDFERSGTTVLGSYVEGFPGVTELGGQPATWTMTYRDDPGAGTFSYDARLGITSGSSTTTLLNINFEALVATKGS